MHMKAGNSQRHAGEGIDYVQYVGIHRLLVHTRYAITWYTLCTYVWTYNMPEVYCFTDNLGLDEYVSPGM